MYRNLIPTIRKGTFLFSQAFVAELCLYRAQYAGFKVTKRTSPSHTTIIIEDK